MSEQNPVPAPEGQVLEAEVLSPATPVATQVETDVHGLATVTPAGINKISVDQALMTLKVSLTPAQRAQVGERLKDMNFLDMGTLEVASVGQQAVASLAAVNKKFLERIDLAEDPRLFDLFTRLAKGVEDAKLPDLAERILSGKLTAWERFTSLFSSKSARKQAAKRMREQIVGMVKSTTTTLCGRVDALEAEVVKSLGTLQSEVMTMEALKQAYNERISDFVVETAVSRGFVEMSRPLVAEAEAKLAATINPTPQAQSYVDGLRYRLETANSVAAAREGTLTRIPTDQQVISMLQAAGVMTYVETLITAPDRFNQIRSTLIQLNTSLQIKGTQDMINASAVIAEQLNQVNKNMGTQVMTVAANLMGENRLRQAREIQEQATYVVTTRKMMADARIQNATKIADARKMFEGTRDEMAKLAAQIDPATLKLK